MGIRWCLRASAFVLALALLPACGGGSSGGGGAAGPEVVTLSGTLGGGYVPLGLKGPRGLAVGVDVDRVLAIQSEQGRIGSFSMVNSKSADINPDGTFSIALEKDYDWILVLVNTTAPLATDRFVGYIDLSAGGPNSLLLMPATEATTSSHDMGAIAAAGDTAVATNPLTSSQLSLTATQLGNLAKNDDRFKSVKNLVLNYDSTSGIYYTLRPDFKWRGTYASIQNAFPDLVATPAFYTYNAYNFQLDSNSTEVTIEQIGASGVPRVAVELFTPVGTTATSTSPARTYDLTTPIANNAAVNSAPAPDGSIESTDDDFYATNRYPPISYSFGSSLGGTIPDGYWSYKVGAVQKAQFDVAVAKPIDPAGKPLGVTPVIRVNTEAVTNRITSIDIQWYYLDGGVYVPLSDLSLLSHLVGTGDVYLDNRMTGSAYESITFNPSTDTSIVPPSTWYFDTATGPGYLAESIGIFYESSGVGFFFDFFKP